MSEQVKRITLNGKRIILYYLLYCFLFILGDLLLISIFSFFHFLLDHDMNTIENWLNRNTWEILSAAKLFSLILATKITKLNFVDEISYRKFLKKSLEYPTIKIWGLSLFLLIIFYAFITQFGGGVETNKFKEELFYSSFFGSFIFYITDFVMLFLLMKIFIIEKKEAIRLMYISFLIFLLASKLALPYLSKYYIFLFVHFVTLYLVLLKKRPSDLIIYAIFVIAPLSSLYGIDIVWDNAYALFNYQQSLPIIGVIGIWSLGLGYYYLSSVE